MPRSPLRILSRLPKRLEVEPQPEIPKQISTVIIENNRLSVEFVNVNFGEILQSIGKKAGFQG